MNHASCPARPAYPVRRVLISGASIAGPALAYWLDRYGFEVTVVERAPTVRRGGYAIDIRGTAREVVDRMGLLTRLREAHVDSRRITFVDADGETIGSLRPEQMTGGKAGFDLEVRRGDLADILCTPLLNRIEFLFDDSIAALDDEGDAVHAVFDSGARRTFDLVIGADGLHSNTRRLVFGPEEPFHHYLGHIFAGFTLPNEFGLAHEAAIWNVPGRGAVLYAHEPSEPAHGFLTFTRRTPPFDAFRDPKAQRALVAAHFPERVWHLPRLVEAMREADDLFFDVVSQIHMPTWSCGRVALAGDAAHATSFISGQGSSVSLVGAYILAGELATHTDHGDAFAAYERRMRPFAERNQALATEGGTVVTPTTQEQIDARNAVVRDPQAGRETPSAEEGRAAHSVLVLPDYAVAVRDAAPGRAGGRL
ncbi:FAD-dependent monooxygenase [Streptomyces sp. NBC_00264]|uniref:FAD-dependent monooxygenase n=1 Tax=unclassified Streptomyces TaxID=2593676 RepID=UPI000F5B92DF|nr:MULTISPECIES: FAD-dependent monooxygenase [unclassified Streptomyces]WSG56249.1 FAD-dependent monooxygenase [Streptomyces sp. NBC_01732]WSX07416.1 FAD-dependent monooxygenase [Streptomyces sp. NBC_00987]MCX4399693.1 FAD-dependent monooxygenase [Streptomyces sp. NBC_01767]MCX5165657.1 FAD-dependent monooxygenase [Streptomyces sp. NBC_00305]MCX5224210.1 FAD-dependent monooxygenase [Streptomyces sp. NBC_00264]